MRYRLKGLFLTLFFILPTMLAAESQKDTKKTPKPVWNQKMQGLYKTLSELLMHLSSEERFLDKSNHNAIEQNAKKLSELAHDLSAITRNGKTLRGEKITAPDNDPSLPILSHLFAQDAKQAYQSFKTGHKKYSRRLLRSVTNYCITCHTRSGIQASFSALNLEPAQLKALSLLEKADFYAATRQFDKALALLEQISADENLLATKPFEWEKALRYALIISVRAKNDPDTAIKILIRASARKNITGFLKHNIREWKKSLEDWQKEGARTPNTEEGYYGEAVRLVTAARNVQQYPADHSGDIYYYRASSTAHEQLARYPDGRSNADGLLLLGITYEALDDLDIWSLHDMYYESCIRKAPHTQTARSCYNHYEKSIFIGYSGSGGISIPPDERKKLNELKALSDDELHQKQ